MVNSVTASGLSDGGTMKYFTVPASVCWVRGAATAIFAVPRPSSTAVATAASTRTYLDIRKSG